MASVAGLAVTVLTVYLLLDAHGIVALPLGFAAGLAAKVVVSGVALAFRLRTVGTAPGIEEE
jgi:hypothetical protein